MSHTRPANPLDAIPPASEVRERLAENIREARLLRQMLKLAEKADKGRGNGEESSG
jgi:hypothetical protein